ncbi:helix-turn-helix domain-containing protein [Arsenophonus symbiont of Ornithomya chloropus]|uniref:helix-turn-helix domain-containing protein n=1 Tax=Arsenophonus symbiont of Ornithomya chloropus TaxID=634121 RepID=UPI0032B13AF0
MNITSKTETTEITIGQRLLQAREALGFSLENVAEKLCLKVCIVRAIENNNSNDIDPTFLRGYIRSYAKLLKIPEKEILDLLEVNTPKNTITTSPVHTYSLGKIQKKREGWLMKFTWLIMTMIIAMISIWWWQDHKVEKQEIKVMAKKNQVGFSDFGNHSSSKFEEQIGKY